MKMRSLTDAAPIVKVPLILLGIVGASYLSLCIALRFWQTRLIFFPPTALQSTPADINLPYEEVWLPVSTGQIHGWWIPASVDNAPVVLYFHGNASNVGDLTGRASRFHQLGLSVMLIDYRGYGRSSGPFPNEALVYEDAEAAWNYLTQTRQITPENIFLYGQSLGGAIAIELANRHSEIAGLIVESSFSSLRAMVDEVGQYQVFPVDWILTQRFDSIAKVSSFEMPLLFIHGTADSTIPPQMSRELFATAPSPNKHLLLIPEAGHNNVVEAGGSLYLQELQSFIQQVYSAGK